MTLKRLRDAFWDSHPEYLHARRARKRQNDYRADIRCAWCSYVDYMAKDGAITEAMAQRATL